VPIEFRLVRERGVSEKITPKRIASVLATLPRKAVDEFYAELIQTLLRKASLFQVSAAAVQRYPALSQPGEFVNRYAESLKVGPFQDGWSVFVDTDTLTRSGLPVNTALLLEYGDPVGIPPLAHWRPTIEKFRQEIGSSIARGLMRELLR